MAGIAGGTLPSPPGSVFWPIRKPPTFQSMPPPSYKAVVVGATGAVGSALVRELAASPACTAVVALVRRATTVFAHAEGWEKIRIEVVDFERLEPSTAELAAGCDAAFCTMGIGQPRKVPAAEFRRVDVDYAGAFARGAKTAGARQITLLSSVGANAASHNWYLRTKGDAERAVVDAGIARVSLFRPSLLVTQQIRYGLQDRLSQFFVPLFAPFIPARYHQIRVEDLARAMRLDAERGGPAGTAILTYPDFRRLLESAPV